MKPIPSVIVLIFVIGVISSPINADIVEYGFIKQTANGPAYEDFAAQASLQIWDDSEVGIPNGMVLFKFINDMNGTELSGTFSQLYWDDVNGLLSATVLPTFSPNPNHTLDHPSGAAMAFTLDQFIGKNDRPPGVASWGAGVTDFKFDADNAAQSGVEQQEMGGFLFMLEGSLFTDVFTAIENGNLRIAFHGQSIGSTFNSDSFVNATTQVPEPGTALFYVLAVAAVFGRRQSRTR